MGINCRFIIKSKLYINHIEIFINVNKKRINDVCTFLFGKQNK